MKPRKCNIDKFFCSKINKGIKAKKIATVKLSMGHAMKNKIPESRDRKRG